MAVMTELFRRVLDGQIVRYVSVFNLEDAFKKGKSKEKKLNCPGGIGYEITDEKIVFALEQDVPEKETIVVPLTDDLGFRIRTIGEVYGYPENAPCFRMELFSEKTKLATALDFIAADYVDKIL
jgi:hypothetical protein